jgi:uroporphyrinogen-III decarboxylase
MSGSAERLYEERLGRYLAAMEGRTPDRVPIRLSLSEVQAKHAGFSLQEVYYRFDKNIAAATKVISELDFDALRRPPSLFWAALHDGVGNKSVALPGLRMPEDTQYQYVEGEYMRPEDYDAFIAEPTRWILTTYLPRVHEEFAEPGSYRANLALLKGISARSQFAQAISNAASMWRETYGMPMATSGTSVAPFDVLGDALRGMVGIMMDLHRRPEKVLAATEMLVDHCIYLGSETGARSPELPVFMPLHRGAYPFLNPRQWDTYYWPTLKKVIEGLWAKGRRTLFYAESNWTPYLERIAELPERSIVFNLDQTDVEQAVKILKGRFCLSGGLPNYLLAYASPEEVKDACKRLIDQCAEGGGYIFDSCFSMETDVDMRNVEVMVETVRDYGRY